MCVVRNFQTLGKIGWMFVDNLAAGAGYQHAWMSRLIFVSNPHVDATLHEQATNKLPTLPQAFPNDD
jgi:protein-L-isoaspartate O-methyltransferase